MSLLTTLPQSFESSFDRIKFENDIVFRTGRTRRALNVILVGKKANDEHVADSSEKIIK